METKQVYGQVYGFTLDESKYPVHQLRLALDYLALNKFQRKFIESLVGWCMYRGKLTPKQIAAANKMMGRARVYESCIDYPCCGHSKCRVNTFARIEAMLNSGLTPKE